MKSIQFEESKAVVYIAFNRWEADLIRLRSKGTIYDIQISYDNADPYSWDDLCILRDIVLKTGRDQWYLERIAERLHAQICIVMDFLKRSQLVIGCQDNSITIRKKARRHRSRQNSHIA